MKGILHVNIVMFILFKKYSAPIQHLWYSLCLKISDVFYFETSYLTVCLIQKFCINTIYFVMTYSIIRDTLILTYLFYYLYKKQNRTNGQTRSVKIKNITYFGMEEVPKHVGSVPKHAGLVPIYFK